tara:strand:+ start:160 stop:312 length:153 start_codon:yes stop_codon:yes gene_type:complete
MLSTTVNSYELGAFNRKKPLNIAPLPSLNKPQQMSSSFKDGKKQLQIFLK